MGGGKDKEQTIGHKYFLGLHLIVAQKIDQMLALKFGDRIGWRGTAAGGKQIAIDKPTLFGGKEREGGVSGRIDVLDGNPNQQRNSYLVSRFGSLTPAYRGVASLVFRRVYLGNNPYLKDIKVKAKCISAHGGNWYPEKSHINPSFRTEGNSIYIAMDVSKSMAGTKFENQRVAVKGFLQRLKGTRNNIKILTYGREAGASIQRLNASTADYDALISFLDGITIMDGIGTDYDAAVSQAASFFSGAENGGTQSNLGGLIFGGVIQAIRGEGEAKEIPRRVILFLTDGEPLPASAADDAVSTLNNIEGVEVFAFNIDLADTTYTALLDNTQSDGIPVVSGGNPSALLNALAGAFLSHVDMNPAHILRDLAVDDTSGGFGAVNEANFKAAADALFDEGFGLSLVWDGSKSRDAFKQEVERHIDGHMFQNRETGEWEIKLIRNDFDPATLTKFGDGGIGITEWLEPNRPEAWELPNQITVPYTKRGTGDLAAVTLSNTAALQITGVINNEEVEYQGITVHSLAARVCQRDLVARTTPLLTGGFWAEYAPSDINLGTPIIVEEQALGIDATVVRVVDIEDSDGRDNRVLIRFNEDKFALNAEPVVVEETPEEEESDAQPSDVRLAEEMPYLSLVNRFGQSPLDAELVAEPDLGQFHAAGNQPTGAHISAQVTTSPDAGVTWYDVNVVPFAPVATLQTSLSRAADDLTADIDAIDDLGVIAAGSLCKIGSEYLRVDDMLVNGSRVTVTFGRGCLDTVPERHAVGEKVIFWQAFAESDDSRYLATESLDVVLRPKLGSDVLSIDDAEVDRIVFASRAIRPYPVGNLRVGGGYGPGPIMSDPATVTWAHRDRTAQTTGNIEDHTHGSIGPEVGVAYEVEIRAVLEKADMFAQADFFGSEDMFAQDGLGVLVRRESVGTDTSYSYSGDARDFFADANIFAQPDLFGVVAGRAMFAEFGVKTTRGDYESWQVPYVRARYLAAPVNLTAEEI